MQEKIVQWHSHFKEISNNDNNWHSYFAPRKMKAILQDFLAIEPKYFYTLGDTINIFFSFLGKYIQEKLGNKELLRHNKEIPRFISKQINIILKNFKSATLAQDSFNEAQLEIANHYLLFLKAFLKSSNRSLIEKNITPIGLEDLTDIVLKLIANAQDDMQDDGQIVNSMNIYSDALFLGFEKNSFLLNHQQISTNMEAIAHKITSRKKIEHGDLTYLAKKIFKLFSQECQKVGQLIDKFLDYKKYRASRPPLDEQGLNSKQSAAYKELLDSPEFLDSNKFWQEEIVLSAIRVQDLFFAYGARQLPEKLKGNFESLLKHYFFELLKENPKINIHFEKTNPNYLSHYYIRDYDPLPNLDDCPAGARNKFIIKHDGLTAKEIKIICQAKKCADRNYAKWLEKGNQQLRLNGHYTYYVFVRAFEIDHYFYANSQHPSTAYYEAGTRNTTHAQGHGYAELESDGYNWWTVTAHEYTHHLNFLTFEHTPRNFNEGLAYRLITGPCCWGGFSDWLTENRKEITSLKDLLFQEFDYQSSYLLMAYFVDRNPQVFWDILNRYESITSSSDKLDSENEPFLLWMDSYLRNYTDYKPRQLGEGDNYCPGLLVEDEESKNQQMVANNIRSRAFIPETFIKRIQKIANHPKEDFYDGIIREADRTYLAGMLDGLLSALEISVNELKDSENKNLLQLTVKEGHCYPAFIDEILKRGFLLDSPQQIYNNVSARTWLLQECKENYQEIQYLLENYPTARPEYAASQKSTYGHFSRSFRHRRALIDTENAMQHLSTEENYTFPTLKAKQAQNDARFLSDQIQEKSNWKKDTRISTQLVISPWSQFLERTLRIELVSGIGSGITVFGITELEKKLIPRSPHSFPQKLLSYSVSPALYAMVNLINHVALEMDVVNNFGEEINNTGTTILSLMNYFTFFTVSGITMKVFLKGTQKCLSCCGLGERSTQALIFLVTSLLAIFFTEEFQHNPGPALAGRAVNLLMTTITLLLLNRFWPEKEQCEDISDFASLEKKSDRWDQVAFPPKLEKVRVEPKEKKYIAKNHGNLFKEAKNPTLTQKQPHTDFSLIQRQ